MTRQVTRWIAGCLIFGAFFYGGIIYERSSHRKGFFGHKRESKQEVTVAASGKMHDRPGTAKRNSEPSQLDRNTRQSGVPALSSDSLASQSKMFNMPAGQVLTDVTADDIVNVEQLEHAEEKTLDHWLQQLSATDADERDEALATIKQYDPDDALPKLRAWKNKAQSPALQAALSDAIEFLELPEFTPPPPANRRQ